MPATKAVTEPTIRRPEAPSASSETTSSTEIAPNAISISARKAVS